MKRIGTTFMILALAAPALLATEHRAGSSRTSLARAIEIALLKVPGEAVKAEIEVEDGKAVIEVQVVSQGKTFEVEIDGATGKVLKVEPIDDAADEEDDDGGLSGSAR